MANHLHQRDVKIGHEHSVSKSQFSAPDRLSTARFVRLGAHSMNPTRRLAAIVAADVAGYSRLMGADEVGTLEALKECRRNTIDPAIAHYKGRIFKTTGDGILAEFASAVDAVMCAVSIQQNLAERASDRTPPLLQLRIGLNVGDVIIEGDDIFGDGVNVAARIENECEPGQVYLSDDAFRQVHGKTKLDFSDLGVRSLKNIDRPVRVYSVRAAGMPAANGTSSISGVERVHTQRDISALGLGRYRSASQPIYAGTRLNGIYEIDRLIGTGGMGEIYKGHEIQTGNAVAIKMLLPDMAENEAALALFRREASALNYLMHDAIVRYFVFTVEPALQRPYLAMEFVDGRPLSDVLEEGPLTFEALLRLMRRVASGLHAAHERGIIHRDVSPDNIILPQGDVSRAKLIDFGIARLAQFRDATIIGSGFAGKHNYVSPEQIGLYGGDVTLKSDIYSLGLVLFHALTGKKLDMGGTQFQLVEKRRKVPDLGAIDARIRPLLEKMLQPDPAARPASMAEIENWNVGSAIKSDTVAPISPRDNRPSSQSSEAATKGFFSQLPSLGRLSYLGPLAVAVLLFVGTGTAYYEFIWNSPTIAPPPIPLPGNGSPKPDNTAKANPRSAPPKEPASIPQSPADTANRGDLARRFVEQYEGGDCFFIFPVAVTGTGAYLEGFGSSTKSFDVFDKTFSKAQGFDADIGIRLISPPQCPAITFLNKLRAGRSRAPKISLGSVKIHPGETLVGTIENFANRVVELLLITDTGLVQNVSYSLQPGTDSLSFAIPIAQSKQTWAGSAPQLVMAVSSPKVADSLRQPRETPADQFFLQALSEAQRSNMTLNASARYFTLESQ
jgi:class 3 adenylate cyclase/serine/threonine protein kinase